ncbi:hypothetical protein F5Y18DRAFT_410642 [Xylariaceae sp. FL1019]|nr:hypothetical protein F5Y18DRAFT_410642 [Xylariaceae sp. FL1019]
MQPTSDRKPPQSISQPTVQFSTPAATRSQQQFQQGRDPDNLDDRVLKDEDHVTKDQKSNRKTHVLPYLISDGGAYPLSTSLGSELKSNPQGGLHLGHAGKRLSKKLAFVSPEQFQAVQTVLQQTPDEDAGTLAHLELVKKRRKFWQKSSKVPIAFVEKDSSTVLKSGSFMTGKSAAVGAHHAGSSRNQNPSGDFSKTEPKLPRVEDLSTPAVIDNHLLLPLGGHRQNIVSHIQTTSPIPQSIELPGFQMFEHLLVNEREWRERFTEFRVWTIRPFHSDQARTSPDEWDRCMLSEETIDVPQIRLRLAALDKHATTLLEKLAALTISQQIQVMRSVEAAKTGDARLNDQWKLRQLEILRARRLFKQKQVKAITVYAYKEPPAQAFGPAKQPPKDLLPSPNIAELKRKNGIRQTERTRESESGSESESSASKATTPGINIRVNNDRDQPMRPRSRYDREDPYDQYERYDSEEDVQVRSSIINRANEAISRRTPIPSLPPRHSRSAIPPPSRRSVAAPAPVSYSTRTRNSRSTNTVQPTVIINNRVAYDSDDTDRDSKHDYSSGSDDAIRFKTRSEIRSRSPLRNDYYVRYRDISADGNREIIREREGQVVTRDSNRRDRDRYGPSSPGSRERVRRRESSFYHASANVVPRARDTEFSPNSRHNRQPRHSRSRSISEERGNLLRYYNADELRGRARMRFGYPVDFDHQLYDPQASTKAMNEAMNRDLEAVEQLLIEWTPQLKPAKRDDDNNEEGISPSTKKPHEPMPNVVPNANVKQPDNASTGISNNGSTGANPEKLTSAKALRDEDILPRELLENTKEVYKAPPSQPTADSKSEKTLIDHDQVTQVPDKPIPEESSSSHPINSPPIRPPQRRETTDGNNLADRQPIRANLPPANDSDGVGVRMFGSSQRVSTMPMPNRQAWTGIEWARQIVEDTASIAADDDDRDREALNLSPDRYDNRFRRERDTNREYRSTRPPPLSQRNRSADSEEIIFRPPPRRRTVEFEDRANRRPAPERVRTMERSAPRVRYHERDRDSREGDLRERERELERARRDFERELERDFERQRDRDVERARERERERRDGERDREDRTRRRERDRY